MTISSFLVADTTYENIMNIIIKKRRWGGDMSPYSPPWISPCTCMYYYYLVTINSPFNSDTVTRSGMFCAMATVIDRCKTEGVVDVFQVVKALRVQKPGAVPTVVSVHAYHDE